MTSLKSTGTNIGKALLLALGVPYGVAIIVHSVHGWPQSDESHSRFSKQLRPSRVLSLNYVLFQQISMVKWLPLVMQANSIHKKADSTLQNLPFGEDGLRMDIWPPKRFLQDESPVVFFIYGGAWGSGYKELYAKFGQEVADALGAVVVIPDYRIYPKGNMADMVLDITESIHEFRNLSQSFKLPVNHDKIILIGHSAGAHLTAMTAIHVASMNQKISAAVTTENSVNSSIFEGTNLEGMDHADSADVNEDANIEIAEEKIDIEEVNGGDDRQPFLTDSGEARKMEPGRSDLAGAIRGVIGIGGVYHIMDHYQHEALRGVEDLSPMWRAAEGLHNFEKHSPSCVVPRLTEEQKQRLPPQLLIHGMDDTTVPESSSSIYADVLAEAGVRTQLKILAGAGHAELIMDMMEPSRKWYSTMMGAIMEGMGTFIGEL